MIDMNFIRGYFPQQIRDNAQFSKDMLKEYIQFMILDFISTTPYARKLAFIGGTNLRLIKGIDRFSEDLNFDCKNMSKEEFMTLTDDISLYFSCFIRIFRFVSCNRSSALVFSRVKAFAYRDSSASISSSFSSKSVGLTILLFYVYVYTITCNITPEGPVLFAEP